jgi:hypothetical protein
MSEDPTTTSSQQVCLSPKVFERISWLRKAGATGLLLSDKAEEIISKLKSGESWQPDRKIAPRTQHGEKRIRKCIKYDLGWGFRLITVLCSDCLFICYLGPHDECDRWLQGNSRIKKFDTGKSTVYRVAPQKLRKETANIEEPFEGSDDLDDRLQGLSDQAMRRIFCGLVEARTRPAHSIPRNNTNNAIGLSRTQRDEP